jgi:hypothetical protein
VLISPNRSFQEQEHPAFRARPRLPYEPMLPYPATVVDELIQADRILEETSIRGSPSVIALTSLIHLYSAGDVLSHRPLGSPVLLDALAGVRHAFNGINPTMIQLVNATSAQRADPDGSLRIRVEIQRANVMLHSLLLRANIIDRATIELTKNGSPISQNDNQTLSQEREHMARGLLFLLKDISQSGLEPDPPGFMQGVHKVLGTLFKDPKILASNCGPPLQMFDQLHSRIAQGLGHFSETQEFEAVAELRQKQDEFNSTELGRELTTFT